MGLTALLIDKGLSLSAVPNLGLISTILRFPNFIMTTGAAIPVNKVGKNVLSIIEKYSRKYGNFNKMTQENLSDLVTQLVRLCLYEDASEGINYA